MDDVMLLSLENKFCFYWLLYLVNTGEQPCYPVLTQYLLLISQGNQIKMFSGYNIWRKDTFVSL